MNHWRKYLFTAAWPNGESILYEPSKLIKIHLAGSLNSTKVTLKGYLGSIKNIFISSSLSLIIIMSMTGYILNKMK